MGSQSSPLHVQVHSLGTKREACSQICHACPLTGLPAITSVAPDILISFCLVLALTRNCALRPWQALGISLRNQERPFQLPFVEPPFCPTQEKYPLSSLLMPLSLGVERLWGPEAEAEDKKGTEMCYVKPTVIWAHPRLSALTTPFTSALSAQRAWEDAQWKSQGPSGLRS